MLTIALLIASNIFMTFAWYGHLKFPHLPMLAAILIGWGIALIEYSFAVPANRIGYAHGFTGGGSSRSSRKSSRSACSRCLPHWL